ncbi:hypothetical protein R3I94_011220 [Phoxinus phoxinus]
MNPYDAPGVTEAQTEGQDSLAAHRNTKALIKDRGPKGINKCLKVSFEDVIAEPVSVSSFDKTLGFTAALAACVLFAVLCCLHIWLIVPSVQLLVITLHWIKVVRHNVLDTAISPFFRSFGKCWDPSELVREKY